MSLIRRDATAALVEANRANSRKSTGPRTALGKRNASRNAAKHLVHVGVLPQRMKEFGENAVTFEKLRHSLRQAFDPQDGFEHMLVDDMAQIRWRLARLRRAEAGILAAQKRQFHLDSDLDAAQEKIGAGAAANSKMLLQSMFGLGGAARSCAECEDAISVLRALQLRVKVGMFRNEERDLLELVYGKNKGVQARLLIGLVEKCIGHPATGRSEEQEADRRFLIEELRTQIEHFEKMSQLFAAKDSEVKPCMEDAQLMPKLEDLDKIVRYETHLERQFERKLQQLVAWRRTKVTVEVSERGGARVSRGEGSE